MTSLEPTTSRPDPCANTDTRLDRVQQSKDDANLLRSIRKNIEQIAKNKVQDQNTIRALAARTTELESLLELSENDVGELKHWLTVANLTIEDYKTRVGIQRGALSRLRAEQYRAPPHRSEFDQEVRAHGIERRNRRTAPPLDTQPLADERANVIKLVTAAIDHLNKARSPYYHYYAIAAAIDLLTPLKEGHHGTYRYVPKGSSEARTDWYGAPYTGQNHRDHEAS